MRKKQNFLIVLIAIVIISSIIIYFCNRPKDFSVSMVVGCEAEDFFQQESVGYLTIKFDNDSLTKILKIDDIELQKQLLDANLHDIIGISIIVNVPTKELKNAFLDPNNLKGFDLLYDTNEYDDYIVVIDIFLD